MHKLYELKEMLLSELEKYGSKELTAGSLEVVDKLSHAIKNICKILEADEEGEYSNTQGGGSYTYARGGNRGNMQVGRSNTSYAQRRDNRGRYSREQGYSMASDEIAMELRELMQDAPDNQTRQDIQRIVDRLSQM